MLPSLYGGMGALPCLWSVEVLSGAVPHLVDLCSVMWSGTLRGVGSCVGETDGDLATLLRAEGMLEGMDPSAQRHDEIRSWRPGPRLISKRG